ncbi:major facilitator superfamily transporter [Niveomyces insectorum RCEF 264]|uniref:Major facilitator superfamily transporter n=1 Tax=Niveomyces insectorum RCEF 264 TaxID=1081102 RepID=A0A162KDB4_9HYPO|nr:major facilitator superfamily transporter [Niveomyces insectorum RCEF 264]
MVHTNVVGAAAASSANNAARAYRPRLASSGSFHAGDVSPFYHPCSQRNAAARRTSVVASRRRSSLLGSGSGSGSSSNYQTFPTPPPVKGGAGHDDGHHQAHSRDGSHDRDETPLPAKQLALLALLSLAEQTALNSISPYLPTMVVSFEGISDADMGFYVGLLASAFALAQLTTNLLWGYLSDAVGRKPIMLLGSSLLMVCFALFGFCTSFAQVLVLHVAMGLLNGNAAVVPTCLGEVTDRTNQSRAFTWLPVVYSLGSITGPAVGGLLVEPMIKSKYPFLVPNLVSAALLGAAVVVLFLWFDETLDACDRRSLPQWLMHLGGVWRRWWQYCRLRKASALERHMPGAASPLLAGPDSGDETSNDTQGSTDVDGVDEEDGAAAAAAAAKPHSKASRVRRLLNHRTIILLLTYLVFQLANISFNSLYPIFSAAPPPTGRGLSPGEIGVLLSLAGAATIVFQMTAFQPLKAKVGNLGSYRGALCGLALSMLLMPWVSHRNDQPWFGVGSGALWLDVELAGVLILKNICAVGGLSSVMLLINNSAPSHETLGTLNGIAQTLSAAGRSFGPFLSGALFSASTRLRPKGELLAWCIFGGISALGWLLSLVVNGQGLESADWEGDRGDDENSSVASDEETLER